MKTIHRRVQIINVKYTFYFDLIEYNDILDARYVEYMMFYMSRGEFI